MASSKLEIGRVLLAAHAHHAKGQSDGQLLAQFLKSRDEAAFATLVRRHGPMVLGVCSRILGNAADVDDAFQATFLVVVRKARSLASRNVLGDWLHGVARRTALNARRVAARRRTKEKAMARTEAAGEVGRDDWLPLLDDELSRLPEKYRLPIVLCDLEGHTRSEAASRLGWPEGTVAGRLARGRTLLARHLARRGVAMSASALAVGAFQNAAPACVPVSLASSTIRAAVLIAAGQAAVAGVVPAQVAALVEGVLKTMLLSKLKVATTVLFLTAVLSAGGAIAYQTQAGQPAAARQTTTTPSAKERLQFPTQRELPGDTKSAPAPADEPDRIKPGQRLTIRVTGTLPDAPIDAIFLVEASGKVALGVDYGRVDLKGLTLEEAETLIQQHLKSYLKNPTVLVARYVPLTDEDLQRRIQQLEKDVRQLRTAVDVLRGKRRE